METNDNSENRVISYHKIRLSVGFIGMLLPLVLWLGNTLINKSDILNNPFWIKFNGHYNAQANLKFSISHFYYSTVGEIFTGALCAVALFLFCYRGYPKPSYGKYSFIPGDNFMANFAAALGLLVVIFPTNSEEIQDNLRSFISSENSGYIHYAAASLFFFSLAIISFVNFRRTKHPEDFGKMKSHPIYKYCGIIMIVCMLILLLIFILGELHYDVSWSDEYNVTYWFETIILFAFGISWIVKGEVDQQIMKLNVFGNGVKKE